MPFEPMPFIVGAPRSGTTLARLMLDAHPDLSIPPETHFVPAVLQLGGRRAELRRKLYDTIVMSPRWADFNMPAEEFWKRLTRIRIENFDVARGLRCFYATYSRRFGKSRYGDKTPAYSFHMREIAAVLPEARFIHVIRDGRDVLVSNREAWWRTTEDAEAFARRWLHIIRSARRQVDEGFPYCEVRYEDLVRETTTTLKRICDFLALDYRKDMEEYHRSASRRLSELGDLTLEPGHVAASRKQRLGIHRLTRKPPDPGRIGRWRSAMSGREQRAFERIAGRVLREFEY